MIILYIQLYTNDRVDRVIYNINIKKEENKKK
jgi:hypothetical protein